jgi:hypothetical protein
MTDIDVAEKLLTKILTAQFNVLIAMLFFIKEKFNLTKRK